MSGLSYLQFFDEPGSLEREIPVFFSEAEAHMKTAIFLAITLLVLALTVCSCETGTTTPGTSPVSYKVYDKYYYIGPKGQTDTTYYWSTTGKTSFDALFQFLAEPSPVDTVPRADLESQHAISLVKHGNDWYDLGIGLVYLKGDTLQVEYTATVQRKDMTYTVVQSRIAMVDARFSMVRFIENGLTVKLIRANVPLPPR